MFRISLLLSLLLCIQFSYSIIWQQRCGRTLCVPQHVHVAYGGDPTREIVVSYFTLEKSNSSTVKYGTSPGKYPESTVGYEISYLHSDDDDEVFYNHHVLLTDLEPDTLYYYRAGDHIGGWSPEYHFKTAPLDKKKPKF